MRAFRTALGAAILPILILFGADLARANGALAVGACGAYGYARGYGNAVQARSAALAKCRGRDCKVVATVRKSCMAFAVELANPCGAYGYATDVALAKAQNQALRECHRNGGKDCVIRLFACD